ncbi:hypothetical protein F5Y04DRAFT_177513 [Hypomontagnella monticulosa]|nr:hypothetical protein F5Y04DRAFT_177513 [Hypomontagnella monticulosa]
MIMPESSSLEAKGRQSVMSVRSFVAFERDDDEDDNGADVTDILRRRSSLGTSIAEAVASPTTFRKIWAETESLSLLDHQPDPSGSPNSIKSNPEGSRPKLDITTASGDPQSAETRSPSSPSKSIISRSTKSRANSSSSSVGPRNDGVLHGLQSKGLVEHDGLEPLTEEEIDPASFDLISPRRSPVPQYSLEARARSLFSKDHLEVIFDDPSLLQEFTTFLYTYRPKSVPILVYYLDALKALKAIGYANSITRSLVSVRGLGSSGEVVPNTVNGELLGKAGDALEALAREDLPAYITHTWVKMVSTTVKRRVAGVLPDDLKDLSDGLAEVFCLTDPSRHGNPIIFASKEFHKMTQYGAGYVFGRNGRFLQGPNTNPSSVRRIREHLAAGKVHCETLLNYRRDGSPFMNLLMVAPLLDSRGVVRYHLGAQVDVSGLMKECAGLESLRRLVAQNADDSGLDNSGESPRPKVKSEFRSLVEMLSPTELRTAREAGGIMYNSSRKDLRDTEVGGPSRCGPTYDTGRDRHDPGLRISVTSGGQLTGIYEHYLLVRPYPNLRVLFASPSLRIPGMLQSEFMSRIGGPQGVRDALVESFADGAAVTAKIRWVTRTDSVGKSRWVHCTPLLGANGAVGVWMVVLVDDEEEAALRRARVAPPVDLNISQQRPFDDDTSSSSSFVRTSKELDETRAPSASKNALEREDPPACIPGPSTSTPDEIVATEA